MHSKKTLSDDIASKLIAGLGAHKEKEKPKILSLLVTGDSKVKFEELQKKTSKQFHKELALVVNEVIDQVYSKVCDKVG